MVADVLTLTFGLSALVFAVSFLLPGVSLSVWLRSRRRALAEVVIAAAVVSWVVLFVLHLKG